MSRYNAQSGGEFETYMGYRAILSAAVCGLVLTCFPKAFKRTGAGLMHFAAPRVFTRTFRDVMCDVV